MGAFAQRPKPVPPPAPPPPPPELPTQVSPQVVKAKSTMRNRLANLRKDTLLTSPLGIQDSGGKTLLGV